MSTTKNANSTRATPVITSAASVTAAAAYNLPPIAPIKYNEAVIDLVRSPVNNKLTPVESGAEVEKGVLIFEGRATAYKQIIIFDNGVEIARVYTNPNGGWVWSSDAFTSGEHHFTVQVVGAGNPVSASYDVAVGAQPEQPVEVSYVIDDSAGYARYISSGATTNDTTPRFSGTATPNSVVKIFDAGREIGSVQANGRGEWNFTATLDGGSHSLVFVAGKSSSAPFVLNIVTPEAQPIEIVNVYDDSNQYVPKLLKSGDMTPDSTPRFFGKAGANVVVRLFDGNKEIGSTQADSWGSWSLTPKLSAGSYNLVFKAGEGSATQPFALTITSADAQPIEILTVYDDSNQYAPKTLKSGDITQDSTPRFFGKAASNVIIRLFDGEKLIGSTQTDAWGSWSLTPKLSAGSYNLVFKAGEGSDSKPFALTIASADAQPIEIYAALEDSSGYNRDLAPGSVIKDTTPYFYGKAGANVVIRLYNGEQVIGSTTSDAYGSWSMTPTLQSGSYNLVFKAGEGSATKPFPVTIISAAAEPVEVFGAFDNSAGYNQLIGSGATSPDTTPRFIGKAGANTVIRLFNGEELLGSTTSDAYGNWSLTPELAFGSYNLVFKTAEGTASAPFNLTIAAPEPIKPQAPEIEFILDNVGQGGYVGKNETTDDDTPKLSGTAAPNSLVEIFDNGVKIGERRVSSTGFWEFTPVNPAYLANGEHSFVVKSSNGTETEAWNIIVKVPVSISLVGSNSGEETGDNSTVDSTPLFIGYGPKGVLIRLYEGDKEIGSAITSTSDGRWIINITDPLSVGAHNVVAKFGDDNSSAQFDFTITAPEVPVEPENPFSIAQVNDEFFDKGVVAANGATDDTQPSFKGNAPANTLVRIFDNGAEIGSVMANGNGEWTFKPEAALLLGAHAITIGESANNASEAFTFNVVAAQVFAPWVLGGVSEYDGTDNFGYNASIYDNTPVLNGLAVAGTLVTITIDGKVAGSVTANEYGRWSFQTLEPLAAGGHEVIATDAAGNKGGTLIFSLVDPEDFTINFNVYDDNAGEMVIAAGAVTRDSTPLLRGLAGQDIVLEIYDNGELIGSVRTAQDGTWSYSLDLADGDHRITVKGEYQESLLARQFTVEADTRFDDGTHQIIARVNGVESETFTFHLFERSESTSQEETINLFDISVADLLSVSEETLLGKEADAEVQPATALQLSQADLAFTTTSGVIESSTVAHPALQEEQYQAI